MSIDAGTTMSASSPGAAMVTPLAVPVSGAGTTGGGMAETGFAVLLAAAVPQDMPVATSPGDVGSGSASLAQSGLAMPQQGERPGPMVAVEAPPVPEMRETMAVPADAPEAEAPAAAANAPAVPTFVIPVPVVWLHRGPDGTRRDGQDDAAAWSTDDEPSDQVALAPAAGDVVPVASLALPPVIPQWTRAPASDGTSAEPVHVESAAALVAVPGTDALIPPTPAGRTEPELPAPAARPDLPPGLAITMTPRLAASAGTRPLPADEGEGVETALAVDLAAERPLPATTPAAPAPVDAAMPAGPPPMTDAGTPTVPDEAPPPDPQGAASRAEAVVASDRLGEVRIAIEGTPRDLKLSLGLAPAAAALVAAEVPRLVADLAASGVRLQSLDLASAGGFGGGGQGQRDAPPYRVAPLAVLAPASGDGMPRALLSDRYA